jgi:hypothetical protein
VDLDSSLAKIRALSSDVLDVRFAGNTSTISIVATREGVRLEVKRLYERENLFAEISYS